MTGSVNMLKLLLSLVLCVLGIVLVTFAFAAPPSAASRFDKLPNKPRWNLMATIPLRFNAFHPQGLLKIGDSFLLSAVDIREKTRKLKKGAYDRTPGVGTGYLFRFDESGHLKKQLIVGDGPIYHPGGIDTDGQSIWMPVAEYRPNSHSIIYKIDPKSWKAVEAFRIDDHIGDLVYNKDSNTLIGMNWDSRIIYEWSIEGKLLRKLNNKNDKLAFQDCKYAGENALICSGVKGTQRGGLALLDSADFKTRHQIFNPPKTKNGIFMTKNPMALVFKKQRLRYYFIPEDGISTLYGFEIH